MFGLIFQLEIEQNHYQGILTLPECIQHYQSVYTVYQGIQECTKSITALPECIHSVKQQEY